VPIPDTRPGGTVTAQRIRIVHAIQALGSVSVNPVPAISALQPVSAAAGSGGFTLTVRGDNFVSGSVVRWNGGNRTTTYVDAGQLTAAIPAGDVATRGTASVTVSSPQPGGGVSNSASFTITGRLPTFALTVTKVGKGTVTSSPAGINCGSACAKAYATGTSVTLTATASARSVFRTWGGACSGSQPSCRVSMTTARTVKATFR
jgi:hypothetical protein